MSGAAGTAPGARPLPRFPQTDHAAFRIGHPHECPGGNFNGWHEGFSAEPRRTLQISLHVIHLHVNGHEVVQFVTQRDHVALSAALAAGVDYFRGTGWLLLPAEQLRIKLLRP